jgi:hypothetical protein
MSLIPLDLLNSLQNINKTKNKRKASNSFRTVIHRLADWWSSHFPVVPFPHARIAGASSLTTMLGDTLSPHHSSSSSSSSSSASSLASPSSPSIPSLITESTSEKPGPSPNVSAMSFVAACRGSGLEARLICSLHPVPISLSSRETLQVTKYNPIIDFPDLDHNYNDINGIVMGVDEEKSPSKGDKKKRKAKTSIPKYKHNHISEKDWDESFAIRLWAEVYSADEDEWIPINPTTGEHDIEKFEPSSTLPKQSQLSYVIACEQGTFHGDIRSLLKKNLFFRLLIERYNTKIFVSILYDDHQVTGI